MIAMSPAWQACQPIIGCVCTARNVFRSQLLSSATYRLPGEGYLGNPFSTANQLTVIWINEWISINGNFINEAHRSESA